VDGSIAMWEPKCGEFDPCHIDAIALLAKSQDQIRSEVPDLADKGLLLEMDTLDELALKKLLAPTPPATLERAARSRLTHAQEAHQACDRVHRELCGAWGELQSLLERHQLMTSKSQHLRDACSSRSLTQQQQAAWLGELEAAMEHFRQMERATKLLATESVGPSTVCSQIFLDGIAQMEQAAQYFEGHPEILDSNRHCELLDKAILRCLAALRDHAIFELRECHKRAVHDVAALGSAADIRAAEVSAAAQFRAATEWMGKAIDQLQARAGLKDSYGRLLREVHVSYVQLREQLVLTAARQHVAAVCASETLPSAIRQCAVYLARLSADEFELVGSIFSVQGGGSVLSQFLRLLEAVWSVLHDAVRPIIIGQVNLDDLCLVLEVLKLEVPELLEQLHPTVSTLLVPVLERLAQDAQERLIYRAQAFMVAQIGNFYPTPDQLRYPQLLEQQDAKRAWYPTLQRTLDLLSKVWRCVQKQIFEGLAQEATSLCVQSFTVAAQTISRQVHKFDGELFLIKHLATLREQILPFEGLDYAVEQVALDFGSIRHGLAKLFSSQGSSLFSWGQQNLLLQSVRTRHTTHNPKQELDRTLRESCQRFILDVTQHVEAPLIKFSSDLRKDKLPAAEEVDAVVEKADANLNSTLIPLIGKINAYCQGSTISQTLLEPIKTNINEIVQHLHFELHGGVIDDIPLCASLQKHLALLQAIE